MNRLTRYFPVLLGFGVFGCNQSTQPSTFEQAAGEVNESAAALTASDPDAAFQALDQVSTGSAKDESESSADAGTDDSASGTERPSSGKQERRGERPHGRGHGMGLLVWYADLDALKVCRDLSATCPTSADAAAREDQVKACVRPVLEQAFKAMCDEQIATCDASGKSEKSCESIRSTCSGELGDHVDGGTGNVSGETNKDSHKGEATEGQSDSANAAGGQGAEQGDEQKAGESKDAGTGASDDAKAGDSSDDAKAGDGSSGSEQEPSGEHKMSATPSGSESSAG